MESFGEKLHRSNAYLAFKAKGHNAAFACEAIAKIVASQQKYHLFKELFPNEWRESRTSFFKTGVYRKYSERANALFELINEKCFPILGGWNDDPEAEFEKFSIFSLNFDICCDYPDPDDLRISYLAGLLFYYPEEGIWEYFSEQLGVSDKDLPPINSSPHDSLWTCEKTSENTLYVDLFRMVDHSTGNPWLDITNCTGGDWFSFDRETIEYLTTAYKEANKCFEDLAFLDEMIVNDPRTVLTDLITIWNEGPDRFRAPSC